MTPTLPIHGFVLAGGQSSRMGSDKAMLPFRGQPMIATAVNTLREVCHDVSISGNRADLAAYAPIIPEARHNEGPAAGFEAALQVLTADWALFIPVDTPLLPATFLHAWASEVLARPDTTASFLRLGDDLHPATCLIHRSCAPAITEAIAAGQRRLLLLLRAIPGLWVAEATRFAAPAAARRFLLNLNAPEDVTGASKLFSDTETNA